jgi:hypothetical protein
MFDNINKKQYYAYDCFNINVEHNHIAISLNDHHRQPTYIKYLSPVGVKQIDKITVVPTNADLSSFIVKKIWKYHSIIKPHKYTLLSAFSSKEQTLHPKNCYRLLQWSSGAINLLTDDNGISSISIQSHYKGHKYVDKWQWIKNTSNQYLFLRGIPSTLTTISNVFDIHIGVDNYSILMRIHGDRSISIMTPTHRGLSGLICGQIIIVSSINDFYVSIPANQPTSAPTSAPIFQ